MMNNIPPKSLRRIFLPAVFLSILFAAASSLLQLAENSLLGDRLSIVRIPLLMMPLIWTQISVCAAMLGFSIYCRGSFQKMFRGALLGAMGWIALFAALVAVKGTQCSSELLESFYIALRLFRFDFFSLLIWGFLLEFTPAKAGKKYFIPLAAIISLSGSCIRLDWLFAKALRGAIPTPLLLSLGCMAAALLAFNVFWKKLSQDRPTEESEPTKTLRFPFLSAALLLVGCSAIRNAFDFIWKSEIKPQMSTPDGFKEISYFLSFSDLAAIALTFGLAFLGYWFIQRNSWKKTTTAASFFICILAIGLFMFSKASWLSKILSYSLLKGSANVLFFPLVQMLYLQLPSQNRFSVKIATELLVLRLLASSLPFATQVLVVVLGSINAAAPWLKQIAIGLALLMVWASKRAGDKYSENFEAKTIQNS